MATLNSKIILARNIKVDKEYKNVLNVGDAEMVSICTNNAVAQANNYSFIRERNSILVNFPYNTCLQANYIAYQNPDYSNKWFFAWIDEINYKSNGATELTFTVDAWTTWYQYWTKKTCFVVREHVNDDTIGIHTVPENIELGEYTTSEVVKSSINSAHPVVALSYDITRGETIYPTINFHNGIASGLHYYVIGDFTSVNAISVMIEKLAQLGKEEALISIFMVPDKLTGYDTINWDYLLNEGGLSYAPYKKLPTTTSATLMEQLNITKPYNIDTYVPKNNKVFTYPYQYLMGINNGGGSAIYKYEFSSDENYISFNIKGDITPGCSIRCYPLNYKNISENNSEGLNSCKYPICSWATDVYTNWLTQNGVNVGLSLASSTLSLAGGVGLAMSGVGTLAGVSAIASGAISMASSINQVYQHSLIPPQIEGNTNSGDVTYSNGDSGFAFYKVSIRKEYAKIIDEYFTRYGYKVNELKLPNLTGRPYYNYVQIADGENIGYSTSNEQSVPPQYMDIINKICRAGVTIWHNHNNVGDFSVDNSL